MHSTSGNTWSLNSAILLVQLQVFCISCLSAIPMLKLKSEIYSCPKQIGGTREQILAPPSVSVLIIYGISFPILSACLNLWYLGDWNLPIYFTCCLRVNINPLGSRVGHTYIHGVWTNKVSKAPAIFDVYINIRLCIYDYTYIESKCWKKDSMLIFMIYFR